MGDLKTHWSSEPVGAGEGHFLIQAGGKCIFPVVVIPVDCEVQPRF